MANVIFPASVTIIQLPTGTTVTGSELFEAVQTVSGIGQSVQLSLSQMMTLGGLPTGGATGTILNKSSGSNYSTQFSPITSFVTADGGTLTTTGSGTSIVFSIIPQSITAIQIGTGAIGTGQLATNVGLTGTLGVLGTASFSGGIVATGTLNLVGTALLTGAFVLGQLGAGILNASSTGVVSSKGGMVLLNTLSPSAIASTNDTTSLTSAYRHYMFMFDNVVPATNTSFLQMQVATSGSNFTTAGYISLAQVNVSSVIVTDTSTSALLLCGTRSTTAMQTSTLYGLSGFIKLFNPSGTVSRKQIAGEVSYAGAGAAVSTSTLAQATINGVYDGNSNAITGVNFLFNSGNIATGTIKIYGIT